MKYITVVFIATGSLIAIISIGGDMIGLGGRTGIGAAQVFGFNVGVGLILLGVGLLTMRRTDSPKLSQRVEGWFHQISELPAICWVLAGFIIVYVFLKIIYAVYDKIYTRCICNTHRFRS